MKNRRSIFCTIVALLAAIASNAAAPDRLFDCEVEVEAVEFSLPENISEATVLDFSGAKTSGRREGRISLYSDSLAARFLDGTKETLRLSPGGDIMLAVVENRVKLRRWASDAPWLPANLKPETTICDEVAEVAGSDMACLPASGRRSIAATRVGRMIFADGDTVTGAVAITTKSVFDIVDEGDTIGCASTSTRIYADSYAWPLFETRSVVLTAAGATDSVGHSYLCPPSAQPSRPDIAYNFIDKAPRVRRHNTVADGTFPLTLPLGDPALGSGTSATLTYDSGTLRVTANTAAPFTVTVCDTAGRVYAQADSSDHTSTTVTLNCSHISPAVYIIAVTTPDVTASVKLPL